jgi:hypothetical protein
MSDDENNKGSYIKIASNDSKTSEGRGAADTTSDLLSLINLIKKDLKKLNNETRLNQEAFKEEVVFQLESASMKLARRAYEAFTEISLRETNDSIKNLKDLSFKLSGQLSEATKKIKFCFKKLAAFVIAGSVLGGLIGGFIGGAVMRYYPKLDSYVEERYTWGKALEKSWKELSKKEQDKIQKLLAKHN